MAMKDFIILSPGILCLIIMLLGLVIVVKFKLSEKAGWRFIWIGLGGFGASVILFMIIGTIGCNSIKSDWPLMEIKENTTRIGIGSCEPPTNQLHIFNQP